jgi:hypothetical protein
MHMNQQTVNSNTDSYSNGQTSSSESLSLIEAIGQLPRQYIKVLCRPSAQTFREELGKASWGVVLVQFYALFVITVTLSYLAHLIPSSALHTTSAFSIGSFKPLLFSSSPCSSSDWPSFFLQKGWLWRVYSVPWIGFPERVRSKTALKHKQNDMGHL